MFKTASNDIKFYKNSKKSIKSTIEWGLNGILKALKNIQCFSMVSKIA